MTIITTTATTTTTTSTIRSACYKILYLNNFIYIEEYIIAMFTVLIFIFLIHTQQYYYYHYHYYYDLPLLLAAAAAAAALFSSIILFLLFSPRVPSNNYNNYYFYNYYYNNNYFFNTPLSLRENPTTTTRPLLHQLPRLVTTTTTTTANNKQKQQPNTTSTTNTTTITTTTTELRDHNTGCRRIYMRGVNVGGKMPLGHTTFVYNNQQPKKGSFVGTLFDLETIDEHLRRLLSCGFTLLRLNVTWEAIEPEVEGVYDTAYLRYLLSVVQACGRHNIQVIIDSHQDAWSRWTGGDGAPKWTMDVLGMDTDAFPHTRSAMLHCEDTGHLTWFTNYKLYGAGTMFTLFFGGERFAPATLVKGRNVQEWLQSAYIRAWCEVAKVLARENNVLGFEPMNEPNAGWIGLQDMCTIPALPGLMGWDLTPWDSIRLANGESLDVASFQCVNAYKRTQRANPHHRKAWKRTYTDVWEENGVWSVEEGLIKPGYFKLEQKGVVVDETSFEKDFLTPFNHRFALAILTYNPRWWVLCYPKLHDIPTSIAAPHWYDNITLVMNRYIPFLALSEDQSLIYPYYAPWAHKSALKKLINEGKNGPVFLGEVGIPWLGTVQRTAIALEATMSAVDSSFASALTLWNYNPHHTLDKGDGWNLEDFSIWSPETLLSFRMPNAIRPYAMVLAGKPVSVNWEPFKPNKPFTLVFDAAAEEEGDGGGGGKSKTSVIFVPEMHYRGRKLCMKASDGGELKHDWINQLVEYTFTTTTTFNNNKRKVLTVSAA